MENVTSAVTAIFGWLSTAATTITGNEVLCIGIALTCVGGAIGLFKSAL